MNAAERGMPVAPLPAMKLSTILVATLAAAFALSVARVRTEAAATYHEVGQDLCKTLGLMPVFKLAPTVTGPGIYDGLQQAVIRAPAFLQHLPDEALAAAWREMKSELLASTTLLPARTRHLLDLAIAAQLPCSECVTVDKEVAKADGATASELRGAAVLAATTRNTLGSIIDDATFRQQVDQIIK